MWIWNILTNKLEWCLNYLLFFFMIYLFAVFYKFEHWTSCFSHQRKILGWFNQFVICRESHCVKAILKVILYNCEWELYSFLFPHLYKQEARLDTQSGIQGALVVFYGTWSWKPNTGPTYISGHAQQGAADDKKMSKNNGCPFKNPLLCARICTNVCPYILSFRWAWMSPVSRGDRRGLV